MWYPSIYDPLVVGSIDGCDIHPHDRALVRAQHAKYQPAKDPKIQTDPYRTLFVGRLHPNTTEETIATTFAQWGPLKSVRLVRDKVTQASKGYAFVEYETDQDFRDAYWGSNKITIDHQQILTDYERERLMKGWVPRRLGGGLGGKKESGQLRFGGRDRPFRRPNIETSQREMNLEAYNQRRTRDSPPRRPRDDATEGSAVQSREESRHHRERVTGEEHSRGRTNSVDYTRERSHSRDHYRRDRDHGDRRERNYDRDRRDDRSSSDRHREHSLDERERSRGLHTRDKDTKEDGEI